MHFRFLKLSEEHHLSLTKDLQDSDFQFTSPKFWTEDCHYFTFPANHIKTTIPFIGIFTVKIHTSKVSAMWIQQQKFTFTARLADMKWMWNFRNISTWNLLWIWLEYSSLPFQEFGNMELTKRVKYRSLKWSKVNHIRERIEIACQVFLSLYRYYPSGIWTPWKVIWLVKVCVSHVQRNETVLIKIGAAQALQPAICRSCSELCIKLNSLIFLTMPI